MNRDIVLQEKRKEKKKRQNGRYSSSSVEDGLESNRTIIKKESNRQYSKESSRQSSNESNRQSSKESNNRHSSKESNNRHSSKESNSRHSSKESNNLHSSKESIKHSSKGSNKKRSKGHSRPNSNGSSRQSSKGTSSDTTDTYITDENGNSVILPKPNFDSNMVYLNIYDLDTVSKVVNSVARTIGTGAFHAGVEVYGHEYSFGYIMDGETGVTKTKARCHPYHVYRETIPMGRTPLTKEEVDVLVEVMKLQWIGDTYDLLSRNCLNYADYFCNLLDVGGVPDWVMSLQKKITWMKSNISVAATKLKALNKAAGIPSVLKFLKKKCKEDEDYEGCKVIIKS